MRYLALATSLALFPASAALAQDTTNAPATPAPAVVDSSNFAGDWEFAVQLPEGRQMQGMWRINRSPDGRYTGVVMRQGHSSSPIRSFTVRNRSFTMTVEFDAEIATFQGRLESAQLINGTLTQRGGGGPSRLRAQRRS